MVRIRQGSTTWISGVTLGLLCLFTLAACATTDEQRFPLDYLSGVEATYQLETAREALPAYQRMGANLERQGHFADAAIAYSSAALSARALGRLQDALDAGQKAAGMAERAGRSSFHLAIALNILGWTHINLNAPEKAIPVFERSVRYAKESRNATAESSSYGGLSRAYRQLGKSELAVPNSTKAVQLLEAAIPAMTIEWSRFGAQGQRWLASMERIYAEALMQLAWMHFSLRQWDPARVAFQKALEVGKRLRVPPLVASVHQALGTIAARQLDFQVAVRHLEEATRVSPRPTFPAQ